MIRPDRLRINKAIGLKEVKDDLRQMLRDHHTLALKELEKAADKVYIGAFEKVPVGPTGNLQDSIQVDVSRSPRYPGLIITASARNPKTGYDYAFIQEVNESYRHAEGKQAHYLEEPFREATAQFFKEMGWK